ncbi:MAG TPA: protein yceI precursor [Microscillaceae bacterium]|nr:protein yceI precursor [Microscillaceae bacterium]
MHSNLQCQIFVLLNNSKNNTISSIMVTTQTINTTDSLANFQIKMFGLKKVNGTIGGMQGQINFDPKNLAASGFDVSVNLATINTKVPKRDEHLKQADFFDVANHPQIRFKSSQIIATDNGYQAIGTLTVRGIAQEITIPFTYQNNRFEGTLELNRANFKVGKVPGFVVGKKVTIAIKCVVE